MKLNMSHIIKGLAVLGIGSVVVLLSMEPAQAILEGSNRDRMEYLDFSEKIIKNGLYAKTGKVTFNHNKKKFVRGVKRHNEPKIYQPDVYTWELAMTEHRRKMQAMAPTPEVPVTNIAPTPMVEESILPADPVPPAPVARRRSDCRAEDIKRRIVEHMNSLDEKYPSNPSMIPALQPAVYPRGNSGDSYDAHF